MTKLTEKDKEEILGNLVAHLGSNLNGFDDESKRLLAVSLVPFRHVGPLKFDVNLDEKE